MEVQDNMKERLLTMCQRMARRKSAGQKKRTLLQLSEMLGTLGYRTTLIGKKGIHGQQLIGGDPEHARLIVAAVCDGCAHPHQDLCPPLGFPEKIRFKITKARNSTHKYTS